MRRRLQKLLPAGSRRGSVLIIVLVMLLITAGMLTAFMDKASTDLIVEARRIRAKNLRAEAYSALEVTLGVLNEFVQADANALRSPQEGWSDPLAFAGWQPSEGRTVEVTFDDESGKIPLPNVTNTQLTNLFESWDMTPSDAAELTDALLAWMRPNYTPSSGYISDYDQADLPYGVPGRSLLSFDELAAINVASKFFYTEDGRRNAYWYRFADTFSLLSYNQPNLNALPVRPDVLTAVGRFDPDVEQRLEDYLTGTGQYDGEGPKYFRLISDAGAIVGTGDLTGFGTLIRALRINVTVHEGNNSFRLSAVIAPPNGATTIQSTATNDPTAASTTATGNASANQTPGTGAANNVAAGGRGGRGGTGAGNTGGGRGGTGTAANAGATAANSTSLQYPFTILEIREESEPPQAAPAQTEDATNPAS